MNDTSVLAFTTSALTVSGDGKPESFDFDAVVAKQATRQVKDKSNTKESYNLNRAKLVASVCAIFRDNYPALFSKRDDNGNIIPGIQRLPAEYFDKVEAAVDKHIESHMLRFNRDTMVCSVRHVHKSNQQQYVQVRTLKDEMPVSWEAQLVSCHIDMRIQNRRLKDLEKANRLTDETEQKIQKTLNKLKITEQNIHMHLPEDKRTQYVP